VKISVFLIFFRIPGFSRKKFRVLVTSVPFPFRRGNFRFRVLVPSVLDVTKNYIFFLIFRYIFFLCFPFRNFFPFPRLSRKTSFSKFPFRVLFFPYFPIFQYTSVFFSVFFIFFVFFSKRIKISVKISVFLIFFRIPGFSRNKFRVLVTSVLFPFRRGNFRFRVLVPSCSPVLCVVRHKNYSHF
jgi:hypothetical protein